MWPWSTSVRVILGAWIDRRSRRLLGAELFASALLSSLALLLMTDYERAIGSSGLVSGLLMAAIVLAFRRCNRTVALVAGALFGSKLALEFFGLWPAALGGLPPGYEPAAAAHIGGALGGGLIAAAYRGVDGADSPRGASVQPAEPTSRPPRTTRSGAAP